MRLSVSISLMVAVVLVANANTAATEVLFRQGPFGKTYACIEDNAKKSFCIATTEFTQGEWKKETGRESFDEKLTYSSRWDDLINDGNRFRSPDKPVTVSWEDAVKMLATASARIGETVRLPTALEWETAARAGTETKYFFGNDIALLPHYSWSRESFTEGSLHKVGSKAPNPWGLYDIYGNVWEWTSEGELGEACYVGGRCQVRGGSWHITADGWDSAFFKYYPSDYRGISIGFRPVWIPKETNTKPSV